MNFLKKLTEKTPKKQPDPPKRQSIIKNNQSGRNQQQQEQQQVPLYNEEFDQNYQDEQQYQQQDYQNYQEDENYMNAYHNGKENQNELNIHNDPNPSEEPYYPQNGQFKKPIAKKKRSFIEFIQDHPIITTLISMLLLIIVILSIVLPVTLVKPRAEREISPACPDGTSQPRINCLPDAKRLNAQSRNLAMECRSRKCCWSDSPGNGGPNCAFPYNYGFRQTKIKENSFTNKWMDLVRLNGPASYTKSNILNLETKVEMQTDNRMRLRIFPRRNYKNRVQRWTVPSGIQNENVFSPSYRIEMNENPYSLKIIRNSTNNIIFDTTDTSLIFSSQFIQITTKLSSPHIFGIGEHSKEHFLHDMNYKTWPLFASQNHPKNAKEKPNLYSQFPMYLNIEPDGSANVVVFYNSNPSEFYLTPFPSLTYRTIGGILDIYVFTGPTPVQALEQFQQAFGLPKLPPFWGLGLQINAHKYENSTTLDNFVQRFKQSKLPFDAVMIGTEHMKNNTMFTVSRDFRGYRSNEFNELNRIVKSLRNDNRAAILKFIPGIRNTTQNYPFSDAVKTKEKYWIQENFFSAGVTGKILGVDVVYPDFTLEKTRTWWMDAFDRFIVADKMISFDGLFLDYLTPLDERPNKTCSNNKWNYPPYIPGDIDGSLFESTICMDSRYDISKHYNIHGIYSHYMIESTAKALDTLFHSRTMIMSRHGFIGTGQYSSKWLGEYDAEWDDLKRSMIASVEMSMFGYSMAGADVCGFDDDEFDADLCENWIKAGAMLPMMKLSVNSDSPDDKRYERFMQKDTFEILNATLHLRYSLIPYFYTQFYKATKYGTIPIRPLAFEFPTDKRTYKIDNQWLWGDNLMVTVPNSPGGLSTTYLPKGEWYDYYKGFKMRSNGESINIQVRRNETSLIIRGGSIIFREDCHLTAVDSKNTFVDIIIALNETNNFTAHGELYIDDSSKKDTHRKNNYHRLTSYKVRRNHTDGLIEVHRKSGSYRTNLAYRDLIIYGLKSKPMRITVNENTQAIDSSKATWDSRNNVYYVNLQTEVKKKVMVDNEYLSFRWTGGFDFEANRKTQIKTDDPFNFNFNK